MTTFKYCATGLFALAAMIGTAQAENAAWFTENTTSVTKALGAAGVSDDGTWSTAGTLAESLYLGTGEQSGKVCVDTDGENRLTYTPKVALSGDTATVKLENICFTAPVEVDDSQLDGVQAAVAIVNDPDDGLVFKVANNGSWVTWTEGPTPTATDTYTVTCTFDYNTGKVTYVLGNEEYTYEAEIPSALQSTKVSTTEFEGTCSFESLTGEKEEPAGYTMSITLGDHVTKAIYAINGGASVTNTASESGIAVDNGATVAIIEVCYGEGYRRPESGDMKGTEKTVASDNIAFEFSAAVYDPTKDLPSDVTPSEVGITAGAFKDAQPGEVNKVVKWASTKGFTLNDINAMDFSGELDALEQAYLLNCSETELDAELEAFAVASITFDADGKPVIPEGVEGKNYNGTIKKQGATSVGTPDWEDIVAEKAYNFFRFLLVK